MKIIASIFLSSLILGVALQDAIYVVTFAANRAHIARTLCVNKDKPKTSCHGKCFLNSQLSQAHDDDSPASFPVPERSESTFFYTFPAISWPDTNISGFSSSFFSYQNPFPLNAFLSSVFRPPRGK